MPLDSDTSAADSHLSVEFYTHKFEPYVGEAFVRIAVPGNDLSVIDTPARDFHMKRFPLQWLNFQRQNDPGAAVGTKLAQWHTASPGELTEHMMGELQILHFATVEQVAGASDAQLQRVGMGGTGLRDRARAFLARASMSETAIELESTKKELAELRAMVMGMQPTGRRRASEEQASAA